MECKNLNILFGSYTQVHLGTTHTMRERTIGVIVLQKYNEQGYFILCRCPEDIIYMHTSGQKYRLTNIALLVWNNYLRRSINSR